MKTAIPPNGVTARCVSRRINRSSDNKASISRGTGLSVASDSIPLLSQTLAPYLTPNFGFPAETGWFAARPSGTENIYKIYAESFRGQEHLNVIVSEAREIVNNALESGR